VDAIAAGRFVVVIALGCAQPPSGNAGRNKQAHAERPNRKGNAGRAIDSMIGRVARIWRRKTMSARHWAMIGAIIDLGNM
jgi:hypothetical protein